MDYHERKSQRIALESIAENTYFQSGPRWIGDINLYIIPNNDYNYKPDYCHSWIQSIQWI